MSPRLTRRGAIQLLATGALASLATPISLARAAGVARLAPPHAPMLFTDHVRRQLVGDASLTTQRNFEVRFIPLADGYLIDGTQVSSSIDAPPGLEPLAEIWRKTPLTTLFPFQIDLEGFVIPNTGPTSGAAPDLSEAIDVGLDLLRKSGSSETEIDDAHSFFLWLQQAANEIGSDIPRDLLVPPAEVQQASKVVELPGGTSGMIEISFLGTLTPETGLMRQAKREIVTRVEGTSLSTLDNWSLALA